MDHCSRGSIHAGSVGGCIRLERISRSARETVRLEYLGSNVDVYDQHLRTGNIRVLWRTLAKSRGSPCGCINRRSALRTGRISRKLLSSQTVVLYLSYGLIGGVG